MNCKNCFTTVDGRSAEVCESCGSPLHKDCAISDGGTYCDVCYTVRSSEPRTVDFTVPDVIRRTYIETYRSCPYKFFKEVIEGNQPPGTIYTQLGIDLHEWFDRAINDRRITKATMLPEMEIIFESYDEELFGDVSKEKMHTRMIDSIDTFYHIIEDMPIPFTTEQTIHYSIGKDLPLVEFTMDVVHEIDGELELVDWKTGQVMVGQKLSTDLQAPIYIYGVNKHFGKPVRKFTFYYLQENKHRVFERVDDDNYVCRVGKKEYKINLTDAIREVKTVFSHIKKGNFNIPQDTKKMYFTCKMCNVKAIGQCQGADIQSWHNK